MSKILKLKKWVTLEDAASTLSIQLSDNITKADIYQLALDHQIKISVNLYNFAKVILGRLVPLKEARINVSLYPLFFDAPFLELTQSELRNYTNGDLVRKILDSTDGRPNTKIIERIDLANYPHLLSEYFEYQSDSEQNAKAEAISNSEEFRISNIVMGTYTDRYEGTIELDGGVKTISGLWDLPMIGCEELDILHLLHHVELNEPKVTLQNIEGAWLHNPETDQWAQLQESFKDNEFCTDEERKKYRNEPSYYPAGTLPTDASIVIRTSEIQRFIQELSDEPRTNAKTENKQQDVIRTLASAIIGPLPDEPTESEARSVIATLKDEYSINLNCSAKTLRKYLIKLE